MLLILIAMQVIGVYFVRQLETTLKDNFKTSIQDKVNILEYYLEEQLTMDRLPQEDESKLRLDIQNLLGDYRSADIEEVRVIEGETRKILGSSDPDNQGIVGQKSTDTRILRIIATGQSDNEEMIDRETGKRIWVLASPVKKSNGEVIGAIYFVSKIENVFGQMKQINQIFATGTALALVITAVIGIFLARAITRPITDMRKQALALSRGNFSRKVKV